MHTTRISAAIGHIRFTLLSAKLGQNRNNLKANTDFDSYESEDITAFARWGFHALVGGSDAGPKRVISAVAY